MRKCIAHLAVHPKHTPAREECTGQSTPECLNAKQGLQALLDAARDAIIWPWRTRGGATQPRRRPDRLNRHDRSHRQQRSTSVKLAAYDTGGLDAREAQFAVELYCYRARKCLGAYLAVLGGCDGIVLGGSVGEHVPGVRERILWRMRWAGAELGTAANRGAQGSELRISAAGSPVTVRVIAVREETSLVRAALGAIGSG